MLVTRNWAALMLGLCIATGAMADNDTARPQVADRVVAYSGTQGVKVWTLRYAERSANQALVQIEGVDHDWDKRIQQMTVEKTSKDTRYSTQVDGKKYVALIVQGNYGELYLPGEAQTASVGYDEGLSSQGNAQHFLTDYLEQSGK
ncbi:hypothetical protein NJC38_24680 [Pseudomonas sp. 21LCFQ010]|uniref:hypothetical protein n=1 Tax=Pseudomonas sp. 21LCFQ010 TaxID=2957506 RepID=UPI002098323E|nr:hypothetical protein [Pseudomonas sp. 21LCFQ010]MCO8165339.1 hypothetical protein [Pseudomonas sp. 21LCFQ010]